MSDERSRTAESTPEGPQGSDWPQDDAPDRWSRLQDENRRLRGLLEKAAMFVAKWSVEEREDVPGRQAAGRLLDAINAELTPTPAQRDKE